MRAAPICHGEQWIPGFSQERRRYQAHNTHKLASFCDCCFFLKLAGSCFLVAMDFEFALVHIMTGVN